MNIYRIDLTDAQGQYVGSETDCLGTCLYRSRAAADSAARAWAFAPVPTFAHVIRISGAGLVRRVGIVAPCTTVVARTNDAYVPRHDAPRGELRPGAVAIRGRTTVQG